MFTEMPKRPYHLKKRAASRDDTRQRIAAAAAALHEELGPRHTTISAIAERAGVQRLTVYRHFPDEATLFEACSGHWRQQHPEPDPARWMRIADPEEQARTALTALYVYYSDTRRLWAAVHRDEAEIPAIQGPLMAFRAYLRSLWQGLAIGHGAPSPVQTTLAHAVQFPTWQSLECEGLDDGEKADLVLAWLDGLRRPSLPPPPSPY